MFERFALFLAPLRFPNPRNSTKSGYATTPAVPRSRRPALALLGHNDLDPKQTGWIARPIQRIARAVLIVRDRADFAW
jgi:hypothetical protein